MTGTTAASNLPKNTTLFGALAPFYGHERRNQFREGARRYLFY